MPNLYELNQDYLEAIEVASLYAEESDGVLEDCIANELNNIQLTLNEKIENTILFIKSEVALAKAIRDEEKALAERRKVKENRVERMKVYLGGVLNGSKFESAKGKISYRRSKSTELYDIEALPKEYWVTKDPEPSKTLAKQALDEGKVVPGARIVENVSIQVK
jgi:hypothetical protein